ncbi:MAG: 50S ribosomal protein L9 [Hyphomicrobiales bacterium]|nr:MAG: 50S ribosomal protein L9 [Hyphomicrobiales bacterium]
MQVILLERIAKLGQMGDVVTVKDGFARNFLLPQGKALRANKHNMARFDEQRAQLEARNLELKSEAEALAEKLEGQTFIAIRQAGDSGQLYGSVTNRDIAGLVTEGGFSVTRNQIVRDHPIKTLGLASVTISLHPEVTCGVIINVARTEDEAVRQARGEDVTLDQFDDEDSAFTVEEAFEDEDLAREAEEELSEDEALEETDSGARDLEAAETEAEEEDKG